VDAATLVDEQHAVAALVDEQHAIDVACSFFGFCCRQHCCSPAAWPSAEAQAHDEDEDEEEGVEDEDAEDDEDAEEDGYAEDERTEALAVSTEAD